LIERYEDGRRHLFDLEQDVGETTDLADKHPEMVKQMTEELHSWYATVEAKFLQPRPQGPQPWSPER